MTERINEVLATTAREWNLTAPSGQILLGRPYGNISSPRRPCGTDRLHAAVCRHPLAGCKPRTFAPLTFARYLHVERKNAPVQANREIAFFASRFPEGIEQGMVESNPCRQVKRNKEKPPSSLCMFPNRRGQAYTAQGFKSMWSKIKASS